MRFDLLIQGGEVLDPGFGYQGKLDVAIKDNRIAAVDHGIPKRSAGRVIDADGLFVTPGLVDLHTHVYHGGSYYGISPDPVAARSGVTTWLDVGTAGAYNFPGFREFVISPAKAHIYGLLNISSIGLTAPTWELGNLDYCDVDLCCKLIDLNRDVLLGIKVRIDARTTMGNGLEPLRRAREAADRCELPLMVHIGDGPPALKEILDFLSPGDVLTHCFTGLDMRIIDHRGKLQDDVRKAWDSGVILDVGHGAGSFSFETAQAMMAEGHLPDVISSDIHQLSIHGPMFDLPTCLSKFLALGMKLPEVIEAATAKPAKAMGLTSEVGTLKPGTLADLALFRVAQGDYTFYDVFMNPYKGTQLLCNTMTIIEGQVLPNHKEKLPAPWVQLTDQQLTLIKRGHRPSDWCK